MKVTRRQLLKSAIGAAVLPAVAKTKLPEPVPTPAPAGSITISAGVNDINVDSAWDEKAIEQMAAAIREMAKDRDLMLLDGGRS